MLAELKESQRAVTADSYITGAHLTLEPHSRWRGALAKTGGPSAVQSNAVGFSEWASVL